MTDPTSEPAPIDFGRRPVRAHLEAWFLDRSDGLVESAMGARKADAIGAMTGPVLEIGPGTGVNLRHYRPGTQVIAIEPNPAMHRYLRAAAAANDIDLVIHQGGAEHLDLADESVDGAVGTLVLCGVPDPARVLAEVVRVLRPGRPYFVLEHVVAPAGSMTRRVQRVVKAPHRWAANGCEVDRDTESTLRAAGFSAVDIERVDVGPGALYVRHGIVGTATK